MTMLLKASTNVVRYFMMRLAADGKAATGLTVTTFDLQYTRELTAAAAKSDGIVGTGGATTHVDNKVFEIGATDSPGLYMVCFPDAAFATGVDQVTLNLTYDSTVFTEAQNIQLVAFDPFDAVRMGMTALPNAAADGVGGLVISDAGGQDYDALQAAGIRLTSVRAAVLTDWIDAGRLDALLDLIKVSTDRLTAVRAATMTDWINGGRLDNLLDAIPTTAMRGTDGANTATPLTASQVNAEVVDVLVTDLVAELTGVPAANASIATMIKWMCMGARNEADQTATLKRIKADNSSTIIGSAVVSTDGTTTTREKFS